MAACCNSSRIAYVTLSSKVKRLTLQALLMFRSRMCPGWRLPACAKFCSIQVSFSMWNSLSRRGMLELAGLGLGGVALETLLTGERIRAGDSVVKGHGLRPKPPHFRPRAKSVILMMQNGAPSQMDLFDPKPELSRRDGQFHVEKVETFQKGSENNRLAGTPFTFRNYCFRVIRWSE